MPLRNRKEWERREALSLSPYATKSRESLGRRYPEESHDVRPEFQRDRERIVHCAAFRSLEYKTQLPLNGSGDHVRTRLTHTIEVASLSRSICRALGLNEDLAEAVALARDLGHPPFGHPVEHALDQLMQDSGGFGRRRQSLRVVEQLEVKYPEFNGLNLTHEVRQGIDPLPRPGLHPSLEAQVVDLADEIAHSCHDLEDALESGLIDPSALLHIELWKETESAIRKNYARLDPERTRRYVARCLADLLVEDATRSSDALLTEAQPASSADAQAFSRRLIAFTLPMRVKIQNLRTFLHENLYHHPGVRDVNQRSCQVLQGLFEFYHLHPHLIADRAALRIKKEGVRRAVCDFLAGLTDRTALQHYARHVGTDGLLRELAPHATLSLV
ncbi:MAG: HD domain-containing protein [Proteobacteria bacterium]|nr:HD domain-containing protein [Pseudomonadota bacterium]NBS50035.1 HD domain-containing protein [Verrucomicrobiota bacterium]